MPKLGEKHSEATRAKLKLAALIYWRRRRYKERLKADTSKASPKKTRELI